MFGLFQNSKYSQTAILNELFEKPLPKFKCQKIYPFSKQGYQIVFEAYEEGTLEQYRNLTLYLYSATQDDQHYLSQGAFPARVLNSINKEIHYENGVWFDPFAIQAKGLETAYFAVLNAYTCVQVFNRLHLLRLWLSAWEDDWQPEHYSALTTDKQGLTIVYKQYANELKHVIGYLRHHEPFLKIK